jgi:hypothetical protein
LTQIGSIANSNILQTVVWKAMAGIESHPELRQSVLNSLEGVDVCCSLGTVYMELNLVWNYFGVVPAVVSS